MKKRTNVRRLTIGASGIFLVVASAACGSRANVAGPTPVQIQIDVPRVVAVLHSDGVVLKAEHLQSAQIVEGIIEWTPQTAWFQAFDEGRWWFDTPDWVWEMYPDAGRVLFGIWRDQPATGNGMLGIIRLGAPATIQSLRIWVDGQPIQGDSEDLRSQRIDRSADVIPTAGETSGAHGAKVSPRWTVISSRGGSE